MFILSDVGGPAIATVIAPTARIRAVSWLRFTPAGSSSWCSCRGVLLPALRIGAAHRALMPMKPSGTSQDAVVRSYAVISARPPALKHAIDGCLLRVTGSCSVIFLILCARRANDFIDSNASTGIITGFDTAV
jgi:hypothetical protein